jgi:AhpD family alkylhydroperoxidase
MANIALPQADGNEIARALSYDPDLAKGFRGLSDAVRHADLDPRLHELVRMRVAQLNGCLYCQAFREQAALDAGVTEELLALVEGWRESPAFREPERVALEYTERFMQDSQGIDADLFTRLHAHFEDGEIVLLTAAIAKYMAWGRFVQVLDLEQQSCSVVPAA